MRSAALTRVLLLGVLCTAAGCAARTAAADLPGPAPAANSRAVRDLQVQLGTIFGAPVTAHATWGIAVASLDRGDSLFEHNAGKLLMPASNMKILTLAAAAEHLGWDYRFTTSLETSAPVEGGVLRGDLYLRGNGDPTISTRRQRAPAVFDEWAAALKAAGITSIDGRIIGDDQAFDDAGVGPGWSWDYLEAGYAAPIGALQFNENAADLVISPGEAVGDPVTVRLAPGSGFTVVNLARTTASGETVRGGITVQRRIDRPELEISGNLPLGSAPSTRVVAVINPTLFFVQSLKDALIGRGLQVTGPAVDGDDLVPALPNDPARKVLVTTQSPPLKEVATVLMKVSQNQYAETLLKAVGATRGGLGTTAAGRRAATETFTQWGLAPDAYVISDGSGLSRYNYVSPAAIIAILRRMHEQEQHREAFRATLPVAGKDGTISTRMRRSRAEGNAIAKTGSIANVRSLSGYVRARNGEMLVFAILANDFVTPAATVTWIADLAVEVLANFSR